MALLLLFNLALHAQPPKNRTASSTTNSNLRFEVATIKPHDPRAGAPIGIQVYPGGRVEIIGVPLKQLVGTAVHVSWFQISGSDASTEKILYDIEAVPPENLRASFTNLKHTWFGIEDERLRQMLTALLIDRFQLKFHREAKTRTVYLLQRGNRPFRLVASTRESKNENGEVIDPGFGSIGLAGNWALSDTSMAQLAKFAGEYILHAPVLDETHIDGYFDYRSPIAVDMSQPNVNESSFISFISEIGLRLKKSEGPVETIVIDHVESPSAN